MTDHYKTDLEFMKIIEHFTMEEVAKEPGQGLPEALEGGLTPVMVKETVYQAVDHLLSVTNEILTARGVGSPAG